MNPVVFLYTLPSFTVIGWLYCKVYVGDSVDIGIDAAAYGRILGPTRAVQSHVCRSIRDPYSSGLDYTNTNDLHTQYHSVLRQITAVNYRQVRGVMRAECEGAFGLL